LLWLLHIQNDENEIRPTLLKKEYLLISASDFYESKICFENEYYYIAALKKACKRVIQRTMVNA